MNRIIKRLKNGIEDYGELLVMILKNFVESLKQILQKN